MWSAPRQKQTIGLERDRELWQVFGCHLAPALMSNAPAVAGEFLGQPMDALVVAALTQRPTAAQRLLPLCCLCTLSSSVLAAAAFSACFPWPTSPQLCSTCLLRLFASQECCWRCLHREAAAGRRLSTFVKQESPCAKAAACFVSGPSLSGGEGGACKGASSRSWPPAQSVGKWASGSFALLLSVCYELVCAPVAWPAGWEVVALCDFSTIIQPFNPDATNCHCHINLQTTSF